MPKFVTLEKILKDPWLRLADSTELPPRVEWQYKENLCIDDIRLWEEIHNEPGNISVYAAWDPYAEFYMLVYNLYAAEEWGRQCFYGPNAAIEVQEELKKFNISLPTKPVWVVFPPTNSI